MKGDWESHTWAPVFAGVSGFPLWGTLFLFPISDTAKAQEKSSTIQVCEKEKDYTALGFWEDFWGFWAENASQCLALL